MEPTGSPRPRSERRGAADSGHGQWPDRSCLEHSGIAQLPDGSCSLGGPQSAGTTSNAAVARSGQASTFSRSSAQGGLMLNHQLAESYLDRGRDRENKNFSLRRSSSKRGRLTLFPNSPTVSNSV